MSRKPFRNLSAYRQRNYLDYLRRNNEVDCNERERHNLEGHQNCDSDEDDSTGSTTVQACQSSNRNTNEGSDAHNLRGADENEIPGEMQNMSLEDEGGDSIVSEGSAMENMSFEDEIDNISADGDAISESETLSTATSMDSDHELHSDEDSDADRFEDEIDEPAGEDPPDPPLNPPLYTGAEISQQESMLMLLKLSITHNVTQTCLSEFIDTLNAHCPRQGLIKNSLYKFKQYFNLSEISNYKKHYYCHECLQELADEHSLCPDCKKNKGVSFFAELPFLEQLQEMFKRNQFYEELQHKFHRNIEPGTIKDIYDGSLYQQNFNSGFLSDPDNISLTWYTDGIPVFKSSHVSMTPVYSSINELSVRNRTRRENILLMGLWSGDKKPMANLFLNKLRPQLVTLAAGIRVELPGNKFIVVRGIPLFGTCDLPAKCEFLNMVQFNGEYGCLKCKWPGETFHLPSGGTTHVYAYARNPPLRTSEVTIAEGIEALNTGIPVAGVKGPCALSKLMPDFIGGAGIDRMHGFDGGVIKKLLMLWFTPKYRDQPFSLIGLKELVNEKLKSIRPPKFVHRIPRSLDEVLHWKASELKMWGFYYSIPVLSGLMPDNYFQHHLRLIKGMSMLSSDCVTRDMLQTANHLLHQYVREFQVFYGLRHCSINIHLLLHYAKCVEVMGPLWCYTCYPYEDLNGKLLGLVHGTGHIESQISLSHHQFLMMKRLMDELEDGPVKEFCLRHKKQVKICERISPHCYSVGSYSKPLQELPLVIEQVIDQYDLVVSTIQKYKRLLCDEKLIVSKSYLRSVQNDSSCVNYVEDNTQKFGSICYFIKVTPECECEMLDECTCRATHYAVMQKIECIPVFRIYDNQNRYTYVDHLYRCRKLDGVIAIPLDKLISVCVYMEFENDSYIAVPINLKELE